MTVSLDKWQRAQELEAEYHRNDKWRKSPAFMEDTGKLFEFFGFEREQFIGQMIMDVGAGSKRRTDWFDNVSCLSVIEPMYGMPGAEEHRTGEDGKYSAVFCINVLDHTYDPKKVVENCIAYLAEGGTLCLSTDFGEPNEMHPAVFTEADVEAWLVGMKVERKLLGIPGSKGYRDGCEAVTWICSKD